ncbi:hypothetical protein ACTFIZ_002256 [Dictyostelium cf. discoideum]
MSKVLIVFLSAILLLSIFNGVNSQINTCYTQRDPNFFTKCSLTAIVPTPYCREIIEYCLAQAAENLNPSHPQVTTNGPASITIGNLPVTSIGATVGPPLTIG